MTTLVILVALAYGLVFGGLLAVLAHEQTDAQLWSRYRANHPGDDEIGADAHPSTEPGEHRR